MRRAAARCATEALNGWVAQGHGAQWEEMQGELERTARRLIVERATEDLGLLGPDIRRAAMIRAGALCMGESKEGCELCGFDLLWCERRNSEATSIASNATRQLVKEEIRHRGEKFGWSPDASRHESLGIVTEEYGEWREARGEDARRELAQIAACAIWAAHSPGYTAGSAPARTGKIKPEALAGTTDEVASRIGRYPIEEAYARCASTIRDDDDPERFAEAMRDLARMAMDEMQR